MLDDLKRDGIALALWRLSEREVGDLLAYLGKTKVYDAHVQAKSTASAPLERVYGRKAWPVFCHSMHDVILAPHLFEAALRGYDVARSYFDEEPRLYSMNIFWTQPGGYQYADTHDWHRDGDDRKQLVMFMYGTDVMFPEDGAHLYQCGTPSVADDALGYPYGQPPEAVVQPIFGPAGTCFFSDTRGLHMGVRPDKPRMLAWARWGVSERPVSYDWDRLEPVPRGLLGDRYPESHQLRRAIELVTN